MSGGAEEVVVERSFRITAVRTAVWPPAAVRAPVAPEEIAEALWTRRSELETSLAGKLPASAVGVTLTDVRADGGILARFRFSSGADVALKDELEQLTPVVGKLVGDVLREVLGNRLAVAAVPLPEEEAKKKGAADTSWDRIAPLLGAIATGVGVVGFVTFIGGVILWGRLDGAGFPGEHGLSVVPATDLLVIGAVTLLPRAGVGLAAVAALWALWIFVGRRIFESVLNREPRFFALALFSFIFIALIVPLGFVWYEVGKPGLLTALAIGLALVVAMLANRTTSFVFLGSATFVAVAVFLTWLEYSRAKARDDARAGVVIREKEATVGYFVAEGADRVYLARVNVEDDLVTGRSRLVGIKKDQVTDLAVGAPKPRAEALTQAVALARELCELQPRAQPAVDPEKRKAAEAAPRVNCWTAPPGHPQPDEERRRLTR